MKKDYLDISLLSEINKKINTINKTRNNRIHLSQRLKLYNDKWRVVFFILNIEAVFFVVLSLVGGEFTENEPSSMFRIISSFFSIYVILAQYYVSQLNYSERSLKSHYHQLELEDLILSLKSLILEIRDDMYNREFKEKYNNVMIAYQRLLKNNENHDPIDNDKRERTEKIENDSESRNSNSAIIRDFSPDNIILTSNIVLIFVVVTATILTY